MNWVSLEIAALNNTQNCLHCLAEKRYRLPHIQRGVQKIVSDCVWHIRVNLWFQKSMSPVTLMAVIARHTSVISCNGTWGLTLEACYLRVHLSTEMQPSFNTNQNVCSVHFSIIHPVKLTVQKIQFCFMIFITEFDTSFVDIFSPPCQLQHIQQTLSLGRIITWTVFYVLFKCHVWPIVSRLYVFYYMKLSFNWTPLRCIPNTVAHCLALLNEDFCFL